MKIKIFLWLVLALAVTNCDAPKKQSSKATPEVPDNNMLADMSSDDPAGFQWMNEPGSFEIKDGTLQIVAGKETDFFNNPEDSSITSTAPYLYKEMEGDFVAVALVSPNFSSMWNAVALTVHIDSLNWIKFAFENSDATGPSMVSVVTKNISDDANGVILDDQNAVWLKVVRKGNVFSMLWSLDGKDYKMTRLTAMRPTDKVKVGIEAQCPVGDSATHDILYFHLENKTVKDLRKGT